MSRKPSTSPGPDELPALQSYTGLRMGIAIVAFLFPFALWFGGRLRGIERQHSLSAYFHAVTPGGFGTMHDVFVETLLVIAAFLYLYKGYTTLENRVLNAAGIFAAGVAVIPMPWPDTGQKLSLHGVLAAAFFFCIAFVCIVCAQTTLRFIRRQGVRRRFLFVYQTLGIAMIALPAIAWLWGARHGVSHDVFLAEASAVMTFALYWAVKTYELWGVEAVRLHLRDARGEAPVHEVLSATYGCVP